MPPTADADADDDCSIVSPPRPLPLASLPRRAHSSSGSTSGRGVCAVSAAGAVNAAGSSSSTVAHAAGTSGAGKAQAVTAASSAAAACDDDDDDEVECVGVGRAMNAMPHARYDCTRYPFGTGCPAHQSCEQCWCARCGVPVGQCTSWHAHCTYTAAEDAAAHAAQKKAEHEKRLAAVAVPPPPVAGSEASLTALHPQWPATRYTALSWLSNCAAHDGKDEEGVLATMMAVIGGQAQPEWLPLPELLLNCLPMAS
jgi:hypothetical protein